MSVRKALYSAAFLLLSMGAAAQINIYVGGNLQGNYSWIRGDENTFKPGMGGGFSFVYWEYEYWFIKAGVDYSYRQSSSLEYHDYYGTESTGPEDKIIIERKEHHISVPLSLYFRPWEDRENALLLVGTLEPMFAVRVKENSDLYGETVLSGSQVKQRVKTNLGVGVGYQRQLDRYMYLNVFPSFHFDMRSDRPFTSIKLTAELIFGVY